MLPSLDLVYVGLSAGSMIMTPQIGKPFVRWHQPDMNDDTLGLVDFAIYPHLDHEKLPSNTMGNAIKWAVGLKCSAYAIDDQTAIQVIGDQISVISEGKWRFFEK